MKEREQDKGGLKEKNHPKFYISCNWVMIESGKTECVQTESKGLNM